MQQLFYAYFTNGPNTSASAQYDNTRGAWLTPEGCTKSMTESKGRNAYSITSQMNEHWYGKYMKNDTMAWRR